MTKKLAAAAVATAALAVAAPAALAHVDITGSSPKAGATVKTLPKTVTVTFEDIIVKVKAFSLVGRDGKSHAVSAKVDPRKRARVLVITKNPITGRYTLSLTVTGADGHTVKRGFTFRAKG